MDSGPVFRASNALANSSWARYGNLRQCIRISVLQSVLQR